jgi:alpha-galactosidase
MNCSVLGAAFLFASCATIPALWTAIPEQSIAQVERMYSSTLHTEAKRSPTDFTPDGRLTNQVWKKAKWVEFHHDSSGQLKYPGASTSVAAVWTDDSIYFAFRCRYDALNTYEGEDISKERWELWNRDVAEAFLNPQPERMSHYYEFEVAPNNQWIDLEIDKRKEPFNDASWNSGFEHATHIDHENHVWTAEMRIPLRSMKVQSIRLESIWRVNFFRAAGHGPDSQRMFLAWSPIPEGKTFHVPSRFGVLRFVR